MRSIMRGFLLVVIVGMAAACARPAAAPARPLAQTTSAAATRISPTPVVSAAAPVPVRPVAAADATAAPVATPTETAPAAGASALPSFPELTRAPHRTQRPFDESPAASALDPKPTHTARGTPRPQHKPPAPAAIPGVSAATDVPYIERPGCDPHQTGLDIYLPSDAHGLPVLVFVHGGGWSAGDHEPVGAKAAYFTGRGFVLVSINYRLAPIARPAEQAADVAEAVAWVKENIAEYGGDGERLFLLGHSAGAHLSALIASDETYLQKAGLKPSAIRGVVLLDSAAYDVEQLMPTAEGQSDPFQPIFGKDPAAWRAVSPRAHVAAGKGIPPHLILLATAQGQRRPAAEGLAASLRAAGVYAQIADATAFSDHGAINERLGHPGDAPTAAVQTFLDMLLRGAPVGLGGVEVLRPAP